jgi:Cyclin, N-terminal domain
MVDLLERIESMHKQETSSYATRGYLEDVYQRKILAFAEECNEPAEAVSTSSMSSSTINEVWREKICEWSYQVIDHFDFSREVVGVSMHYLDRFLATRTVNKKMFQLVAMTALYLAIKLYEPGRLTMTSMIELSRGYFTVEQMAAMEMSILR